MEEEISIKYLIEKYPDFWEKQRVEKGTFLYEIGKPIRKIFYCEKGIVRVFSQHKYHPEKEITNSFFSENDLIVPVMSLMKKIPSFVNMIAIENCTLQVIKIENWNKIKNQEPKLDSILYNVMFHLLDFFYNYQNNNSYKTNIKYKELFAKFPYLNRVNKNYIAEMLGVDVRTLINNF